MSEWVKLKSIAEVITGFPFKGELYSDNGIRTVRGENVTEGNLRWDTIKCWNQEFDKEDDYLLKADDVVIGMDGSKVGKNKARIKEIDLPLLLAQRVACVRAKKNNDQIFLYYLINNPRFEEYVFRTQTGSSVPHISKTQIEDYEVPHIEYKEQKNIAAVLSALDDKIALNNRINAELEAMAKTVYDYWFVQFDFSNAEGKPYKSSGGKMVWSEELKREVPEGWEVGELKDIANFTTGKLDSNAEVANAQYPFYTCSAEPTTTDTYAYDDTVILIAGNNASGNFHINRYKGKFNAYQRTYIVTAKEFIDLEYIYQVLNTETKLLKTQGKGSQTKFLTIGMLTGIKVIRNKEIMILFHEMVNPMYEKQEILRKENQQLSSLRDWLLPMLMNGQVSVDVGMPGYAQVEEDGGLMAAEPKVKYGCY